MRFLETLQELERISEQLKGQGITVEKLDRAIADLKTHYENIEKIEANIDAIKQEVISPLEKELEQNKTAGKFSIFGFWVGAIGLIVSIGTIFFQQSSAPETARQLDLIERELLSSKAKASESELFLGRSSRQKVASDDSTTFYIAIDSITEWPKGQGLKAGVKFFRGSNQIGNGALEKVLTRSDGKSGLRSWYSENAIGVAPGDVISLGRVSVEFVRIFSQEPTGRPMGDEKDGVLIRIRDGAKT